MQTPLTVDAPAKQRRVKWRHVHRVLRDCVYVSPARDQKLKGLDVTEVSRERQRREAFGRV